MLCSGLRRGRKSRPLAGGTHTAWFGVPSVTRRETRRAALEAIQHADHPGKLKNLGCRTLPAKTGCYSRHEQRHRVLELSPKPQDLPDGPVDQRSWRQYQAYLGRIRPVARADFYKRLMERQNLKTVRAIARVTGEDWSRVAKVLKILELPAPVLDFLRTHDSIEISGTFTERRLRELLALGNPSKIWNQFRSMLKEISEEVQEN